MGLNCMGSLICHILFNKYYSTTCSAVGWSHACVTMDTDWPRDFEHPWILVFKTGPETNPLDTEGQLYNRQPFSLLQPCSEWEGMIFFRGLWKPLPQGTVNILSRFLVLWKSFISVVLFLFSLTQSPVLQKKNSHAESNSNHLELVIP